MVLAVNLMGSTAALYIAMNTRYGMYKKIQTYSFYEVDKLSAASLITRLSNDTNKYAITMQMIITMLFRAPITIAISLVNAFTPPLGNTTYGIIILCIIFFMLLVVGLIGIQAVPSFTKAQKELDITNGIMRENILGARVIKAFNIQDNQSQRYDKENKELKKYNIRGQALMLPIMSIIQFILNAGIIVILIVAGVRFHADSSQTIDSGIFAFTQLIAIVLFSTLIAIMVLVFTIRSLASVRRINEVFSIQPSVVEVKNPTKLTDDYTVKFNHVNFKYNKDTPTNVLDDVSFEVPSGKTLGIVGGTGSGKSTIASLLPRFYDTTSGSVTIGGVDVKETAHENLNDVVSVVLQESVLFSGTIESNLKFGKEDATENDMNNALSDACALDFVNILPEKIQAPVEQRGRNFSGGQKQRLAIARTLIKKPKVLVLDDTTSALDLLTEAQVQENLKNNYYGSTKIIISQRIASVKNADKIIVLDSGKVVGEGTHDALVKNNLIYREIVESQLGKEGAQ
ncbi:ABC transporter ATP-binding protein [Bacilli bacterium]|nr:ABC transporter ATP-binding protein [Bacilli bacterium]